MRLHQAVITTRDLPRAKAFYTEVMGLRQMTSGLERGAPLWLSDTRPPSYDAIPLSFVLEPEDPAPRPDPAPLNGIVFATGVGGRAAWTERLTRAGVRIGGRAWTFQQEHLCFSGPDGFDLALIEEAVGIPDQIASNAPPCWVRGVEIQVHSEMHRIRTLLGTLGYRRVAQDGLSDRFESAPADLRIDILNPPGSRPRSGGAGRLKRLILGVDDALVLDRLSDAVETLRFPVRRAPHVVIVDLGQQCDLELELRYRLPPTRDGASA